MLPSYNTHNKREAQLLFKVLGWDGLNDVSGFCRPQGQWQVIRWIPRPCPSLTSSNERRPRNQTVWRAMPSHQVDHARVGFHLVQVPNRFKLCSFTIEPCLARKFGTAWDHWQSEQDALLQQSSKLGPATPTPLTIVVVQHPEPARCRARVARQCNIVSTFSYTLIELCGVEALAQFQPLLRWIQHRHHPCDRHLPQSKDGP